VIEAVDENPGAARAHGVTGRPGDDVPADGVVARAVVDADTGRAHALDRVVLDQHALGAVPELDRLASCGARREAVVDVTMNVVAADQGVRRDIGDGVCTAVVEVRESDLVVDEVDLLGVDERVVVLAHPDTVDFDIADVVVRDGGGAVDEEAEALVAARVAAVGIRSDQVAGQGRFAGCAGDRGVHLDLRVPGAVAERVQREIPDRHVASADDEAVAGNAGAVELEFRPVDQGEVQLVARADHPIRAGADLASRADLAGIRLENDHAVSGVIRRAVDRRVRVGDHGQQAGDADRPPVAAAAGLVRSDGRHEAHRVRAVDGVRV